MRCARVPEIANTRWKQCFPGRVPSPLRPSVRIHFSPFRQKKREFTLESLTTVLIPPAVFGGLFIVLWTYKCVMMVIFQNKIIYMPSIPPFARSEKVYDYAKECLPVEWEEYAIKSLDGTVVKLLEGGMGRNMETKRKVVVLYFQGNAASTPPRLPYLSSVLKQVQALMPQPKETAYSVVALSYRGFWTSKGRASQKGIELDAAAALQWIFETYPENTTDVVIWGQSIGAGVATTALSNLISSGLYPERLRSIRGVLLETPFVDMASMLVALYPQKFLPYRYLTPFLQSSWDSKVALVNIAQSNKVRPKVLILQAGDDEIVPADHAGILEDLCKSQGLHIERKVVSGALHTEIMAKASGRILVARFLQDI